MLTATKKEKELISIFFDKARGVIPQARIRFVEKKLIVLAHGESALVDEQHDQTDGEKSEDAADDFNWCHKPPQQSQPQAVVSLAGRVAQKVRTVPGEGPNGTDYSPVGKASR